MTKQTQLNTNEGVTAHENNQLKQKETICRLIANQVASCPNRIAVIDGEMEIKYKQLDARSDAIAAKLISRGVAPRSLVGICMNRTWELMATILGVLKAGCAYVPLDPTYPKERIGYMLDHSQAAAAIVDSENTAALCPSVSELIWLKDINEQGEISVDGPSINDLAYVIYTSGSTGKPKGVAVEHQSVVALSNAMKELLSESELSGVLAATSVCFDPSVMEILGTLSLGGTVVLAQNALQLPHLCAVDKVKTCIMVPSAMQALLSSGELPQNIECLVFGGEMLKRSLVSQLHLFKSDIRVINVYGPTEDTVFSTVHEVSKDDNAITIGKPVTGSQAYILDDSMEQVTVGVAGELYLAGDKLARGYLHDEALSKKRFVEMPGDEQSPSVRLYRTGDLCSLREDGEIEFLSRVDQQVKVRGYRIEFEEIESTLETMDGVKRAAAAALDGGVGQKILAVYVISEAQPVNNHLVKSYLAERLPKYMVPQVIMHLSELPYLPNGKLNRNQLPTLDAVLHQEKNAHQIPEHSSSDLSVTLAIIQSEIAALVDITDVEQVGAKTSFDDLGLDSLTRVELAGRLSKVLGQQLSAQAIYQYDCPEALAKDLTAHADSQKNGQKHSQEIVETRQKPSTNSLAHFQSNIQSSHPTFQAAKAKAWSATDKGKLVQAIQSMVNDQRRNPYSKVLRTGSGTRGTVADAYTDEEREAIIWTTNLYLGMNRDEEVIKQAGSALQQFGTGMGTSAAASGLTDLHLQFERAFAELVGKPAACLFPTGYTANIGAVAGLLGENDVVVIDQLCHASIVDGARLCGSTIRTFQHNNPADLERVLASEVSPYRTVLVVIEGVYSMGEGAAPVAEIVRTAKKHNALVLVDEAHSFGFYGERGAGICAAQGVTEDVDFIMTTLSKSLGSLGGVIAARKEHIDLLKSSSRAYIFQASVSPADIAAALTALKRISEDDSLRERLWDTARYMRVEFEKAGFDLGTGDGPIVTPHFGDKDKLYAIVQNLYKRGIQTSAVTYPIVEKGRGRLRFICSAAHTREDVDKTLRALIEAERDANQLLKQDPAPLGEMALGLSDIENWAQVFSHQLKQMLANQSALMPDLAIAFQLNDQQISVKLEVVNQVVSVSAGESGDETIASCVLRFTSEQATKALCESDLQGLLHSICDGTCELNGQVEPFIWFVGRLVDWHKEDNGLANTNRQAIEMVC